MPSLRLSMSHSCRIFARNCESCDWDMLQNFSRSLTLTSPSESLQSMRSRFGWARSLRISATSDAFCSSSFILWKCNMKSYYEYVIYCQIITYSLFSRYSWFVGKVEYKNTRISLLCSRYSGIWIFDYMVRSRLFFYEINILMEFWDFSIIH